MRALSWGALAWISLAAAAFLLTHPYLGVRHDNVLYLAQAFRHLYPEVFAQDLFFRFGSQDDFSAFSLAYARLIALLGVGHANIVLVLGAQALFLAACYALARELFEPRARGWSLLFIVCSSGLYGSFSLLRIAEPFVTPRPLVEAITLFALAAALRGRPWLGGGLLAAAALLHPLMAFAGLLAWWWLLVLEDRRWLALAALGIVPLLAAAAGIAPFSLLFASFDPPWLEILLEENWHLFVLYWERAELSLLAVDAVILAIAARSATRPIALLARAALAAGASGLVITLLGADLLGNVLLTSLQAWRALWLTHWVAAALTAFVVAQFWREGGSGRLLGGLALFAFLMRGNDAGLAAAALLAVLAFLPSRPQVNASLVWLVLAVLAAAVLGRTGLTLWREVRIAYALMLDPGTQFVLRTVSKPVVILALAAAIAWLLAQGRAKTAAGVAAVMLAAALLTWDQRSNWLRHAEAVPPGSHPFSAIVGPGQEVFWQHQALGPWLLMKRMSYASKMQAAGQMFSRATAFELKRRREALAPLEFQAELCQLMNSLNNRHDACEADTAAVADVCTEAGDLDFIVLESRLDVPPRATWVPPADVTGLPRQNYLYECRALVAR